MLIFVVLINKTTRIEIAQKSHVLDALPNVNKNRFGVRAESHIKSQCEREGVFESRFVFDCENEKKYFSASMSRYCGPIISH